MEDKHPANLILRFQGSNGETVFQRRGKLAFRPTRRSLFAIPGLVLRCRPTTDPVWDARHDVWIVLFHVRRARTTLDKAKAAIGADDGGSPTQWYEPNGSRKPLNEEGA